MYIPFFLSLFGVCVRVLVRECVCIYVHACAFKLKEAKCKFMNVIRNSGRCCKSIYFRTQVVLFLDFSLHTKVKLS